MDQLFNSQSSDFPCKGKRGVGCIKSDGISFSNYANIKDEPLLSHSSAVSKAAAEYKPSQTPQNSAITVKTRRNNQMASHLFEVESDPVTVIQPEGDLGSNSENENGKGDSLMSQVSEKSAAGSGSSQIPNNEFTRTARHHYERTDILGIGVDEAGTSKAVPVSVEPQPEDPAPLDLTLSENTQVSCDEPATESALQSPEITEEDESKSIVETPACEPAGSGEDLNEKVLKTGKRHFGGRNESQIVW